MKSETYPNEMAKEYEFLLGFYPEHYKLREEVAKILSEHFNGNAGTIIDIGCGTGETIEYILKKCPNIKVIAIDNNRHMIKRLKEKLKSFVEKQQLMPICKDIFEYMKETEDSSLDAITSSWTIHNFTKNERNHLLKEIFRVLKPKGIFVNMDKYVFDDPKKEQESFEEAIGKLNEIPDKTLSYTAIQHEEDDRDPDIIMKEMESASELRGVGFKDVKFHTRIGREAVMSCFK